MSFNDLLSQFAPNSLKGEIIESISQEPQLSAKQIHSRVKINKDVSYQAVHKALTELEQGNIIQKDGREYSINPEWVDILIKRLNQIKLNHTGKIEKIKLNKNSAIPQVYKFTSVSDVSVTIAQLLNSNILTHNKDLTIIGVFNYGWFSLKSTVKDFIALAKVLANNPNAIAIIQNNTPFGRWILKQYQKINIKCLPIGTKVAMKEDLFINGDYLIEVKLTKETKQIIEKIYNKISNIEQLFKEFALRKEPEMDITVTITKNPSMARFLRHEFETIYKNATKK
ncbi:MAG: hypothetical protein HOE11_05150 [Candidatus Diapherotrites archaeon]|jgi:hypothetical protein|nr:hypothetical protein [Candidatus Diapherotrites archaeon]MBT4596568.1 hypothetical protein [Candidatus Diapherotrites archaeon]